MTISNTEKAVLGLLQYSLFKNQANLPDRLDWTAVFKDADNHAVLPLVLQGAVDSGIAAEDETFRYWRNAALTQITNGGYIKHKQSEITSLLKANNIPYAVLKGLSLSACYPRPELRVSGDIDILFNPDECKTAVKLLCENGYTNRNTDLRLHEILDKEGVRVEPHYMVVEPPKNETGEEIASFLENAVGNAETDSIDGYDFFVLSVKYQAVALLLHLERHITHEGIGLRQLCDWAVFINKKAGSAGWSEEIQPVLKSFGLNKLANTLTKACVLHLGLPPEKCPWCGSEADNIAEELIMSVLKTGNMGRKKKELRYANNIVVEKDKAYKNNSFIVTIYHNIRIIIERDYPICKKYPVLYPFVFICFPFKYKYKRWKTKKNRVGILKSIFIARKQKKLYDSLMLFKPE